MTHPPGAVIIPCQETARYHHFTVSLTNLELPEGSQRIFGMGTSIVRNLNDSIRALRDQDEWIFIAGDDHTFRPNTVTRLLDREADMIVPLCARRGPPFPLVHYGDPISDDSPYRHILQYDQIPDDDAPFEVKATGSLMLIRRHVLDAVGDPWFTTSPTRYDEEFQFCDRVRAAGYRILVDPAVTVGHIGEIIAYPARRNGEWGLHIDYVGADRWDAFYPGGMRAGELANA